MRLGTCILPVAFAAAVALAAAALPAAAQASGFGNGPGPLPTAPYSGFNPVLARAPYVTDLAQTSAVVTWATNPDIHGTLYYGPLGNCMASSVPVTSGMVTQVRVSPNPPSTYPTRYDYQSSVPVTGLNPGTAYCYEVFGSGDTAVDLLPASQPYGTFTTLDPASVNSTQPLTFDVLGDVGETSDRGSNTPTSVNSNQAAIDSLIGSSGARFAIAVGDIAYNDGGNYNYGDLQETSYPSDWYAFSSGNIRFYILDGSWTDANVGTPAGSACPYTAGGINCKIYQVDADAHFLAGDEEYQWLADDLHAHPGGIKLAFFHFPLRSDNATQDSDVYLQQNLEPLLAQNGVGIAFSGHAHDYERNTTAGPNTILSYVTGGGGGAIQPVAGKGCSPWDAYAIGWSYSAGKGSKCGSATAPASDAQAYHFLKVTVSGNTVTVHPINAAGQEFALQNLPGSSSTLYAQGWINVASQSTTMTLFGLRTQATGSTPAYQVAQVYLNSSGTIKVLNNITKASYLGNTTVPPGGWHEVTFAVNETAGTMQVWLDGTAVQFSTSTGWNPVVGGQNLGAVPMSNFQLGDDATGRVYSWYADDLTVSTIQPGF